MMMAAAPLRACIEVARWRVYAPPMAAVLASFMPAGMSAYAAAFIMPTFYIFALMPVIFLR